MSINKDINNNVDNAYLAKKYIQEVKATLSECDLEISKKMIDEVNSNGYYIKYLFELSWMDKDDFLIIDGIIMKYATKFESWKIRNSLFRYLAKKGNYIVSDFLLEQFCKENDCQDGRDWNFTRRGVCSSALEVIRDKSKINKYMSIVSDINTRQDSYFFVLLIGELKAIEAIPLLIGLLQENNIYLQSAAIQALSKFKRKINLKPLIEPFLDSKNEIIREYACHALK